MKIKEMRKLNAEQLADRLHETRLELAKERAASEIGTAKNPGRIRSLRKTIARISTLINISKSKPIAKKAEQQKKEVAKK